VSAVATAGTAAAVPGLWTLGAGELQAPKIEYGQLSPTLIVLGAAVVGIVLEAFLPRKWRYGAQLALAALGLASAFAAVLGLAVSGHATTKAAIAGMGAIAVDGPTLFLQGTILLVGLVSVFVFAERRLEPRAHA
jgi:NADH-quinone oxidoreductase subunit N